MPRLSTTIGQLLVNETLPEDMRDYSRVLDKGSLANLLAEVGRKYPEKYREISFKLGTIGREAAYSTGGNSFGLDSIVKAKTAKARRQRLQPIIAGILADEKLSSAERAKKLISLAENEQRAEREEIYRESEEEGNPLAAQLKGAGRGNKVSLASLRGGDWLYTDHRNNIIPVPVLKSYSEGLSPLEYWAGTYGARQGVFATKFATQQGGFFGKQLGQLSHRLVITGLDRDKDPDTLIGLPVDIDDNDSAGTLLAAPAGGYQRNTILTPKILSQLRQQGVKRLLVRSPAVSGSPDGGLYSRDVGVREYGKLAPRGEQVGLTAAQAIAEPVSQGMLSQKHTGGVAGEAKGMFGFDYLNSLVQVPKTFRGGAAHSTLDGTVQRIQPAPAGGFYVTINDKQHYVANGFEPSVKVGDKVEAGDLLSDGIPNPAEITKYKGIGEGRRYFMKAFVNAMRASNMRIDRRNAEMLSRGLINHVRLTQEMGDFIPDDIVPYSSLEHVYKPREGFRSLSPSAAVGKYLERPYLHYTIGTRVKPSMLKDFSEFGVGQLDVHDEEPPFEPEMIRGMANLQHDPDWQTRLFGSGLKGSLLDAAHRGGTSEEAGTSFVPSRAKAIDFGKQGPIVTPKRQLGY